MKLIFKGKVAVVTGGSGGIGLDVSKKLAKFYRDVLKVKDDFNDSVNNEINDLKKIKKNIEDKD